MATPDISQKSSLTVFTDVSVFRDIQHRFYILPFLCLVILLAGNGLSTNPFPVIVNHVFQFNKDFSDPRAFGTDSCVFMCVGNVINHGGMPYRDIFDHKGPLLYLINAVGLQLGGPSGIWLIEMVFLSFGFVYAYKTGRFFFTPFPVLISLLLLCCLFLSYCDSGNLTETWAFPLSLVSLFYFIKYFIQYGFLKKTETMLIGICFGAVLMLRPNMVGLWLAWTLVVFLQNIYRRKFLFLLSHIGCFLLGTLLVLIPLFVWLVAGEAWNDFIDDYIIFNMNYSTQNSINILTRIKSYRNLLQYPFVFLSFIFYIYSAIIDIASKDKTKGLFCFTLSALLLSFIFTGMTGRIFTHYVVSIVPCCYILLLFATGTAYQRLVCLKVPCPLRVVSILLLFLLVLGSVCKITSIISALRVPFGNLDSYKYKYSSETNEDYREVSEWLKQNLKKNDSMASLGGPEISKLYWGLNTISKTKYLYFPSIVIKDNMIDQQLIQMDSDSPDYYLICIYWSKDYQRILGWLEKNHYEQVFENQSFLVFRHCVL